MPDVLIWRSIQLFRFLDRDGDGTGWPLPRPELRVGSPVYWASRVYRLRMARG